MIKSLRPWQIYAVDAIITDFMHDKRHFFCLAATATGKTIMSAEAAKQLLNSGMIDKVLCFCPSNEIKAGIKRSFKNYLGRSMDGSLDAVGDVHTYQGMLTIADDFWSLMDNQKVLVIFDEIHHCAGTNFSKHNSWGSYILKMIAQKSRFTLCLSGTPWRSDKLPITTALYDANNELTCDYSYGLSEAINDGICRKPTIVLIDNKNVRVQLNDNNEKTFTSISQALRESPLVYSQILEHLLAQRFILKQSVLKLNAIRQINPTAGGIVVASSVDHAEKLAKLLMDEFHQSVVVVSYLHPNATDTIQAFREGDVKWIVSVGMISEGTDIPRCQVLCHLSNIRTEMHFRQILGRILRINDAENQEAWLYTFSEPSLVDYSKGLQIDVPEMEINFENMPTASTPESETPMTETTIPNGTHPSADRNLEFSFGDTTDQSKNFDPEEFIGSMPEQELKAFDFELNEAHFIERLIGLFDDDNLVHG